MKYGIGAHGIRVHERAKLFRQHDNLRSAASERFRFGRVIAKQAFGLGALSSRIQVSWANRMR